jgi:hypothetical protein
VGPSELKTGFDNSFFKIGDDFMHLSDINRWGLDEWESMTAHIKRVIDYLVGDEE